MNGSLGEWPRPVISDKLSTILIRYHLKYTKSPKLEEKLDDILRDRVSVLPKIFLVSHFNVCIFMSSSKYIAKSNLVLNLSLVLIFFMLCQDLYHYRCQNVKKYFLASILDLLSFNIFTVSSFLCYRTEKETKQTEKPCDLPPLWVNEV